MVTFLSGRGAERFVHLLTRDLARRNCELGEEYQYLVDPVARKETYRSGGALHFGMFALWEGCTEC
jgi:hypothetical protein